MFRLMLKKEIRWALSELTESVKQLSLRYSTAKSALFRELLPFKNVRPGYMEQHACNNPRADVYHELLSVFDHLSDMETEISALAHQIDNKSGNLDELVERQTMLIEQFERAGGLTYKSRTRSALLGLGFSEMTLQCLSAI